MWKTGASIALCTAMTLTSVGDMLPANWGIDTAYADEVSGVQRNITSNVLADYNTSFDGAENGSIYWWNDGNWSQGNVEQVAHPEVNPWEGCGDCYVKVKPDAETNVATLQVGGGDGIAKLLEKGATYEFSYYAKLEGETAGSVTLAIASMTKSYTEWKAANIVNDTEETLRADQWTKVTGTFVMEDPNELVQISFTGSKGVTFDVDDFRIGLLKSASFNDLTGKQETSSKYYAVATMKPGIEKVTYGTVTIDGEADAAWDNATDLPLTINLGSNVTADARVLWDAENLYVYATVKDPVLNKDSGDDYQQDSLEVFIDEDNGKTASYGEDDKQYRINYENKQSFNGKKCLPENVTSQTKLTSDGYVVEAAFKWTDITPANGTKIGLEFQINDADATGKRIGTLSWYDETGMGWSGSNVYGTVELIGKTSGGSSSVSVTKDKDGNVTAATATVASDKGTISADVVKQLKEAAGTDDVTVKLEVKDASGNAKYTVSIDAKNVKPNTSLKVVAVNKKTGALELVNNKTYKTDKDGNVSVSFKQGADYKLLTIKEATKLEKEVLKNVVPKKAKVSVKKGKTTSFAFSSKLNPNNVKKINYKTTKKSVASIDKNGKITAKKKGTATVKATVTLKNGKTKTVKMKITVK